MVFWHRTSTVAQDEPSTRAYVAVRVLLPRNLVTFCGVFGSRVRAVEGIHRYAFSFVARC